MPTYRIEVIGKDHTRRIVQVIERETDMTALDLARVLVGCDFELWEGGRLVAAVDRPEPKRD